MGKQRPVGMISAMRKFAEMNHLIEKYNVKWYLKNMMENTHDFLVNVCIEYGAKEEDTVKFQDQNDLANYMIGLVKAKHKEAIAKDVADSLIAHVKRTDA